MHMCVCVEVCKVRRESRLLFLGSVWCSRRYTGKDSGLLCIACRSTRDKVSTYLDQLYEIWDGCPIEHNKDI